MDKNVELSTDQKLNFCDINCRHQMMLHMDIKLFFFQATFAFSRHILNILTSYVDVHMIFAMVHGYRGGAGGDEGNA